MTQAPLGDRTAQSYESPRITQFSVFLDNRCGQLLELVKVFDGQPLRLVAMSVVDSADHAVVRLVTSRGNVARELLRRNGMRFSEVDILAVELGLHHSLTQLCASLLSAELNIHYAYPLMVRPHGEPTIALHTDDQVLAGQILIRKLFTLLGENDLDESPGQAGPGYRTAP